MSEKDNKKNKKATEAAESAAKEAAPEAAESAAEAAETTEDTYTVTKAQMEQMEALAKTLADANDKYLRLAAEYDNYRKRTAREKEHLYNDAKIDTIKPFLAVLDNLERGVSQFEEGDAHRQGMELICKQFSEVLDQAGRGSRSRRWASPSIREKHNAVMHIEDETVGGEHRGRGIPEGLHTGRQGSALRHGEGSQLRGRQRIMERKEAVQEQHRQEDRRCMRRHRGVFQHRLHAGASGVGGVLPAGRKRRAGLYHRRAHHPATGYSSGQIKYSKQ